MRIKVTSSTTDKTPLLQSNQPKQAVEPLSLDIFQPSKSKPPSFESQKVLQQLNKIWYSQADLLKTLTDIKEETKGRYTKPALEIRIDLPDKNEAKSPSLKSESDAVREMKEKVIFGNRSIILNIFITEATKLTDAYKFFCQFNETLKGVADQQLAPVSIDEVTATYLKDLRQLQSSDKITEDWCSQVKSLHKQYYDQIQQAINAQNPIPLYKLLILNEARLSALSTKLNTPQVIRYEKDGKAAMVVQETEPLFYLTDKKVNEIIACLNLDEKEQPLWYQNLSQWEQKYIVNTLIKLKHQCEDKQTIVQIDEKKFHSQIRQYFSPLFHYPLSNKNSGYRTTLRLLRQVGNELKRDAKESKKINWEKEFEFVFTHIPYPDPKFNIVEISNDDVTQRDAQISAIKSYLSQTLFSLLPKLATTLNTKWKINPKQIITIPFLLQSLLSPMSKAPRSSDKSELGNHSEMILLSRIALAQIASELPEEFIIEGIRCSVKFIHTNRPIDEKRITLDLDVKLAKNSHEEQEIIKSVLDFLLFLDVTNFEADKIGNRREIIGILQKLSGLEEFNYTLSEIEPLIPLSLGNSEIDFLLTIVFEYLNTRLATQERSLNKELHLASLEKIIIGIINGHCAIFSDDRSDIDICSLSAELLYKNLRIEPLNYYNDKDHIPFLEIFKKVIAHNQTDYTSTDTISHPGHIQKQDSDFLLYKTLYKDCTQIENKITPAIPLKIIKSQVLTNPKPVNIQGKETQQRRGIACLPNQYFISFGPWLDRNIHQTVIEFLATRNIDKSSLWLQLFPQDAKNPSLILAEILAFSNKISNTTFILWLGMIENIAKVGRDIASHLCITDEYDAHILNITHVIKAARKKTRVAYIKPELFNLIKSLKESNNEINLKKIDFKSLPMPSAVSLEFIKLKIFLDDHNVQKEIAQLTGKKFLLAGEAKQSDTRRQKCCINGCKRCNRGYDKFLDFILCMPQKTPSRYLEEHLNRLISQIRKTLEKTITGSTEKQNLDDIQFEMIMDIVYQDASKNLQNTKKILTNVFLNAFMIKFFEETIRGVDERSLPPHPEPIARYITKFPLKSTPKNFIRKHFTGIMASMFGLADIGWWIYDLLTFNPENEGYENNGLTTLFSLFSFFCLVLSVKGMYECCDRRSQRKAADRFMNKPFGLGKSCDAEFSPGEVNSPLIFS